MKPIPQTIGRSRLPRERQILGRADFNPKRRNRKGADTRSALERAVPDASTNPMRTGDAVALRVVDAENGQLTQGLVVLHPFGDRRNSQHPPDLGDRIDHGAVEGAVDKIAHERAVDLEEVDGQRLEVGEGAQPRAEVVEGEAAADALQALEEMYCFREVADSRGLRHLEAHRGGLDAERVDLLMHELEKRLVAERRSGQVDGDDASRIRRNLALGHQSAGGLHHPTVELARHQVVALRGADERIGGNRLAALVVHAQQYFLILAYRQIAAQRLGRLDHQVHSVFLERARDAARPFHVAASTGNFRIARFQDVYAVASRLLRRVAREIGCAHQLAGVRAFPADDDHPDAHADLEDLLVPYETEVGDCLAQLLGDFIRLAFVALHEQHAEFVATEA